MVLYNVLALVTTFVHVLSTARIDSGICHPHVINMDNIVAAHSSIKHYMCTLAVMNFIFFGVNFVM